MLTFALAVAFTLADDPVLSGPQPGEKLPAFKAEGVLNAEAGKTIEPVKDAKGGPIAIVFIHEITRPALQLIRPVDAFGDKWSKDGLRTHFVWLSADRAKTEEFIRRAEKSLNVKAPVSIYSGLEGPDNYGLNRKVTITIVVANKDKVTASFAIIQPNETDAPKVLEAMAKAVDKKPPTAEEIRAVSAPMRPVDKVKPGERDPMLTMLMRQMIQKDNDAETCQKIADEMRKWAGDDRAKRVVLRDYAKQVVGLDYGNEHAKKELKKLAE
jgi:hypothetical protein